MFTFPEFSHFLPFFGGGGGPTFDRMTISLPYDDMLMPYNFVPTFVSLVVVFFLVGNLNSPSRPIVFNSCLFHCLFFCC